MTNSTYSKSNNCIRKSVKASEIFQFTLGSSDVMTIKGANLKKATRLSMTVYKHLEMVFLLTT